MRHADARKSRDGWLSALFAFSAGFVDTAGFIGFHGLFTAHVTGNFVVIGAALVQNSGGIVAKLLALPTFIGAVALSYLYERQFTKNPGAAMIWLQCALLIAFMLLAISVSPLTDVDAPLAVIAGLVGVAAMAVQNAAARSVFARLAPTTVMTGNVAQVTIDLVERFAPKSTAPEETRARFAKMWPSVTAFLVGAIAGGVGYSTVGFVCLLAPIAATVASGVIVGSPDARERGAAT